MTQAKNVPFFNYSALFTRYREEIESAMTDVLERGAFILQSDLFEFEENLRTYVGAKHAFGVADGTNALVIALRAAGLGAGDEVIMPSHTYVATAASVSMVGATPVLVECGPDHMMDPQDAAAALSGKTRALMPVQLNGRTCNMTEIMSLADDHGLLVIEDSAQALGSKYKGTNAGTFGVAGTYSFYPAKILGCFGDGGGIVTNDEQMAEKIGLWRDHGRDADGNVVAWGTNSRLDNLQAAVLNVKFKYFNEEVRRRREIAQQYEDGLSDIEALTLPPAPVDDGDHFDVYQNYELEADHRDELKDYLAAARIGTIIQWAGKPVHQFEALGLNNRPLPKTDRFFEHCLMLPMNYSLADADISWIIENIREFYCKGSA